MNTRAQKRHGPRDSRRPALKHDSRRSARAVRPGLRGCASILHDVARAVVPLQQFDELARRRAERAVAAEDDADLALPFVFGERDDGELAAALFIQHRRPRHDGDAESDLDGALDRLDVVELRRALNRHAVRAEYPVGRASRRHVALEVDEALALKVCRVQLLLFRERVFGAADEDEPVAADGHDFEAATLLRVGDDAHFNRAAQNVAHDARRAAVLKINLRVRVPRHELANHGRQLVQADAVNGRDANRPAHRARQPAHTLFQLRVSLKHAAARLVESLARLRQAQVAATAHAFEQTFLKLRFEAAHLLADRRLRDEVALGGLREAARLDEVAEDF